MRSCVDSFRFLFVFFLCSFSRSLFFSALRFLFVVFPDHHKRELKTSQGASVVVNDRAGRYCSLGKLLSAVPQVLRSFPSRVLVHSAFIPSFHSPIYIKLCGPTYPPTPPIHYLPTQPPVNAEVLCTWWCHRRYV